MQEIFITVEEAASFENISYRGLLSRINRNPQLFITKMQAREGGGKPQVMVSISSLSPKARRAYKATQKAIGAEAIIEERTNNRPWYLDADLNCYIENNKTKYYEAIELAQQLQKFINYTDSDKTLYANSFALSLGISQRTLYRYTENILEAGAWALKLEKEDGVNREYFKVLSLCRKPKEKATFPSLTEEQKAVIQNIWFDKSFTANLGTKEMLFDLFQKEAEKRNWESYPSIKTVNRYVNHLMTLKEAASAQYLAANGMRAWKNEMMLKGKRDSSTLEVMEYVVGDEHTFDIWVQYTAPNGKVKAVRPKLVAWEDMRSRCILGDVICVDANSQTLKESLVKMIYSQIGGVPKILHIDNGKDYTGKTMTGKNRKERSFDFDSETVGFYQSIGIQQVGRSLPYQPWDKAIERFFKTVCDKFSRWFESYTGTLTGSKTYAKRHKDIDKMLERGELLTMEEFYRIWTDWKENVYHKRVHGGLKDAGEKWTTPIEVFENAARYEKAAPPREYAAMLLMKADTALVRNQGIYKFGTLYTDYELSHYVKKHVGIKWDIDDITKLYVYDEQGQKICEAVSAELLQYGPHVSQAALETLMRNQKRQARQMREFLEDMTTPYEQRLEEGRPSDAVGKLDLTIKATHSPKVITLPNDKEYRAEKAETGTRKKTKQTDNSFLDQKANDALSRLKAMNE